MSQNKILSLTSLRFFAAFWVVLYHSAEGVFPHARDLSTIHGTILDMGYVAVSFFFTLSGYILAVTYLPRDTSRKEFWWARFSRVYPLFLLTLLLDVPQYIAGLTKQVGHQEAIHLTVVRLLGNMAMLQAWFLTFRAMDWPNWSLSVETFFYLLFPFLIAFIARWSTRSIAVAGLLTYVIGMLGVSLALHSHLPPDVLKFNPGLHLHAFIFGALLAAIRLRTEVNPRFAPLLLSGATICFAVVVACYKFIPLPFIHDGLLVPAFACLILACHSGNRLIETVLSLKWLVILGEASYGLYLIHIPLLHVFFHFRLYHSRLAYAGYLSSAILLSVLSFYYVETPLRRALTAKRRVRASVGEIATYHVQVS
jgi:peptidoglycan/LPS O-acetylase OafA/YrhL